MVAVPRPELVDVELLKVDSDNPNRMTPKQHKALKSSIEKYGFIVPIITNKDLLVADGEQRLDVAKSMGMTHVAVIKLNVADVDRRLLRQVLNKLRGEHELVADAYEFERIIKAGREDELKHLIDLSDSQIERYLAEIRDSKPEDYEVPEIDKIKTSIKRGDVHRLGSHRLMCGDATSREDVLRLMNGEKANLGLHDPPYGINLLTKSGQVGPSNLGLSQVYAPVLGDDEQLDPTFTLEYATNNVLFGGNYFAPKLPRSSGWIVWDKNRSPNLTYADGELLWTDFEKPLRIIKHTWDGFKRDSDRRLKRTHPTQKPTGLLAEILQRFTSRDGTILDLFGGSGSTLIACEQTGRRCYMMEIDPRYCQVIVDRWEAYTNKKAEMIKSD